jgi:L-ascorbate metabolism protein UlaG (beta-lactamase superfamily)
MFRIFSRIAKMRKTSFAFVAAWPRDSVPAVLELTLIGGPTALLQYGGLRWLTDPAFSPPGEYAGGLVKTTGPALSPAQVEPIDVVLVSHDQHSDNLDPAGREFLPRAGQVLTTVEGAGRLGDAAIGIEPWSSAGVEASDDATVTVTAVPALHGPPGSEPVTGPVIGFVLSASGLPTVYVSGDNASLDVVREIAERCGPIDIAVLFAGAVQLPHRFDGAYLTLSSDLAAQASVILGAPIVIPLHFEGWTHFTQGADQLRAAFAGNGVTDRLVMPARGEAMSVSWAAT